MELISTQVVQVPELPVETPRQVDETLRVGEPPERKQAELRVVPPNGLWPLYLLAGEPVDPDTAAGMILRGEARLDDPDAAEQHWRELWDAARLRSNARGRYRAPIDATHQRARNDRIAALREVTGLEPGDDTSYPGFTPPLLTTDQLAELLQVSAHTVRRHAGQSLPAPLKIGGQLRFRSDAVLNLLERGS